MATLNITPTADGGSSQDLLFCLNLYVYFFPASLETPWGNYIREMLGCFKLIQSHETLARILTCR